MKGAVAVDSGQLRRQTSGCVFGVRFSAGVRRVLRLLVASLVDRWEF